MSDANDPRTPAPAFFPSMPPAVRRAAAAAPAWRPAEGPRLAALTRVMTAFAAGRAEREFAVEQARIYFAEALEISRVRLREAASISKERIRAESGRASAELQRIIQGVADDFVADIRRRMLDAAMAQDVADKARLDRLDAQLRAGEITPAQHARQRRLIEESAEQALAFSVGMVRQMLAQAEQRIRNAIALEQPMD